MKRIFLLAKLVAVFFGVLSLFSVLSPTTVWAEPSFIHGDFRPSGPPTEHLCYPLFDFNNDDCAPHAESDAVNGLLGLGASAAGFAVVTALARREENQDN